MRFIWILAFLPFAAFADTDASSFPMLFQHSANDLSISYLKILFGQVGNVLLGPPNTLVQEIFTVFNLGVMTLAGVLMCYTVVLSVVNTSQEGNPMGHKMSPWVVVRIVTGSAFMMPMSSGYALIQVTTMWMVVQGIGFADQLWSKAVDIISESSSGVYPASATENNPYKDIYDSALLKTYNTGNSVLANFIGSSVCLEASYQSDLLQSEEGKEPSRSDYYVKLGTDSTVDSNKCEAQNNICFVTPNDTQPGSVCGLYQSPQYNASSPAYTDQTAAYIASNAAYDALLSIQSYIQNIFSEALTTLQDGSDSNYEQVKSSVAEKLACVNGVFSGTKTDQAYYESCAQTTVLDSIAETYMGNLGSYAYSSNEGDSSKNEGYDWSEEAKSYGWLAAGAYYTSIAASNSGTISTSSTQQIDKMTYSMVVPVNFNKGSNTVSNQATDVFSIFDLYKYDASSSPNWTLGKSTSATVGNVFDFVNNYYAAYARNDMNLIADSMNIQTTSEGECSFDDSMTTSLDRSIYFLAKYWLQHKGSESQADDGDSIFSDMKLYTRSQLSVAATDATVMYVADPQRGLYVLLNRAMSELLGVKYFDSFAYQAPASFGDNYGSQSGNPKGGHAGGWSSVIDLGKNGGGNFAKACEKGLIDGSAHGLFGQVLATMRGEGYEPLAQMRFMGLNLMHYGVDYFSQVIGDMIDNYSRIGLAYWGLSTAFALTASVPVIAAIWAFAYELVPSTVPAAVAQLMSMVTNVFNSGMNILYQIDQVTLSMWSPLSASMAVTYAVLGFIMGVYMANVPAIIFVFAAISFFMYVIEAMIASVLVALGLTHPEGHDLLGKAEQSVMLFLAAFIRPAAMIMGLIFSMLLMIPAFRLLNFTFIGFIGEFFAFFSNENVNAGSITPLIGAAGVAFLYVYLSMGIINNCFSLIYQIPDRLLRWLGAPTEPSMIQQMVNEVKGSVTEAAKSAGGGAESAAGSAKVSGQANVQSVGWSHQGKQEGGNAGEASVSDNDNP